MRVATVVSASVIAMVLGSGSALAGEQDVTDYAVAPVLLSDNELEEIVAGDYLTLITPGLAVKIITLPEGTFDPISGSESPFCNGFGCQLNVGNVDISINP